MIYSHISDAIKTPHLVKLDNHFYVARFESMKIYSTLAAVKLLLEQGKIKTSDTLLDSSSGIYAYALALACQKYGLKCHIIASKTVDETLKTQLEMMGAIIEPAASAPNLKLDQENRVKRIHELLNERDDIHWMQQYHDDIHYEGYREFAELIIQHFDYPEISIVGGVGSGCSTGAIATYLRDMGMKVNLHGIQPFGSVTFQSDHLEDPGIIIAGIGSAIHFNNVRHHLYNYIHWISFDYSAIGAINLLKQHGIFAGLSSGSGYTVGKWLNQNSNTPCLFIAADTGHRYTKPVFQDFANEQVDLNEPLAPTLIHSIKQLKLPWSYMPWQEQFHKIA
ncbi:pyridoxal-phosphate dependent enzyme [Aliikangiella maris]|uniref:Pyridoxal-phosphate dependent enzyme n=2 Tax=Aliikangiella maris TaxID=3162458 RepID=A0ABV2BUM7_9GAMM